MFKMSYKCVKYQKTLNQLQLFLLLFSIFTAIKKNINKLLPYKQLYHENYFI